MGRRPGSECAVTAPRPVMHTFDLADLAALIGGEADQADFDDLVLSRIEPVGFGIEDDALQVEARFWNRSFYVSR